ncbi:MAG: hypothetical protein WDN24_06565 [Sphingomonas sp.]
MTDDPDHAVFGHRAGRPGTAAFALEPAMRRIMPDVRRVDERDQDVDVDEKGHGSSSRRVFTISCVTTTPSRTGSRRIPLRFAPLARTLQGVPGKVGD